MHARAAPVDGFLNVAKPLGWTSHDVVALVRRRLGMRRVGHAGTLDPAAAGVLPICLGRATRLAERVAAGSKLYAADIRLGLATDTSDAEGRVVQREAPSGAALDAVLAALAGLVGSLEQLPPAYSALKVGGQPAYLLARRGEPVRLAPRRVTVYGLALLDWRPPRLSVALRCSAGTYVRALARDLGASLGCGAHLDALVRLAVGRFALAEALTLETLEAAVAQGYWRELVLPPDYVLQDVPAVLVAEDKQGHFAHGRAWVYVGDTYPEEARAYSTGGRFLGLVRGVPHDGRWQPTLSFVYDAGAATAR